MFVPQGLVVTCSGLNKTVKEQVKLLVERMAGIYSTAFHDGVTHLVTNTVRSEKYQVRKLHRWSSTCRTTP